MTLHYTLSARDHEVIERAKAEIVRLGKAIGEPLDDRPFMMPLGASLHYQGTTRMGAVDDGASVCSPDSEVWGSARPVRRRQRRHPDLDGLQPDAHGRRARGARWPADRRDD